MATRQQFTLGNPHAVFVGANANFAEWNDHGFTVSKAGIETSGANYFACTPSSSALRSSAESFLRASLS
jgi:hypothetical protein